MSNIKYFLPSLYEAMQTAQDEEADLLDNLWDEKLGKYWQWVKHLAPDLVREFYQKVGSLHDAQIWSIDVNQGLAELSLFMGYGNSPRIRMQFKCDIFNEIKYINWPFGHNIVDEILYDEFQLNTDNFLRYVFYTANGKEYTFDGVRDLKLEFLDEK